MNDRDRFLCIKAARTGDPGRRLVLSGLAILTLSACSTINYGDEQFHLTMATPGKDVMWVPTREHVAVAMLSAAQTGPKDRVYDLGSGDGIIPIIAAKNFGASAVGIEYNAELVALSRRNAARAGVGARLSLKQGDIFQEDFSEATVVTLYLGEQLNLRLEPRLRQMRPGTRIVSNTFTLGSWQPDQTIDLADSGRAYLWIVPAVIEGSWRFEGVPNLDQRPISIGQRGQFFDLRIGGVFRGRFAEGRLRGASATFEWPVVDGPPIRIEGQFSGDRFEGQIVGSTKPVLGHRLR